uniref:non-specific serine/threonine protein kinase n=1 Tax=Kalanchoe fedtschenkoi TaxID=63787 RepID=A0A7N0ZXL8_KALFE
MPPVRRLSPLLLLTLLLPLSASQYDAAPCPLNFTVLRSLVSSADRHDANLCQYARQGLRLVQSEYLRTTNSFVPPINSSQSCWDDYQTLFSEFIPNFAVQKACGFQTRWISEGCVNVTTKSDFEALISKASLDDVVQSCNQPLGDNSPCAACQTTLSAWQTLNLTENSIGNVSDCTVYPSIYAAAFANQFGPTDKGTAKCLFSLGFTSKARQRRKHLILIAVICVGLGFAALFGVCWCWRRRARVLTREEMLKKKKKKMVRLESRSVPGLESITGSTTLVKFTFEEIKQATRNFNRDYIVGKGGYGNVYRGVLADGSEIAVKRFKNCSVAGDVNFAHEVEVIASVRHVNLVALKGYCTATTKSEGHQRIIVCDLMKNGSLYDHLFGVEEEERLAWPVRERIALGMARGLAYLHYGAQPGIIHRDIKASNILLNDKFEAIVADFGLAKFAPEGVTHLSTRVAGTMGYVAPEYALYGQLTDRSDIFSFGVVLLELLSGKKALATDGQGNTVVLTDWAWALVRNGKALDVIEQNMPEVGRPEIMEKYVILAVLCSHPQLYARPSMDQVVKILETDTPVASIAERPSSSMGRSDVIGYQASTCDTDHPV